MHYMTPRPGLRAFEPFDPLALLVGFRLHPGAAGKLLGGEFRSGAVVPKQVDDVDVLGGKQAPGLQASLAVDVTGGRRDQHLEAPEATPIVPD